jgi:hypothetical protein
MTSVSVVTPGYKYGHFLEVSGVLQAHADVWVLTKRRPDFYHWRRPGSGVGL